MIAVPVNPMVKRKPWHRPRPRTRGLQFDCLWTTCTREMPDLGAEQLAFSDHSLTGCFRVRSPVSTPTTLCEDDNLDTVLPVWNVSRKMVSLWSQGGSSQDETTYKTIESGGISQQPDETGLLGLPSRTGLWRAHCPTTCHSIATLKRSAGPKDRTNVCAT